MLILIYWDILMNSILNITGIPIVSLIGISMTFIFFYMLYILIKRWEKEEIMKKQNSKEKNKVDYSIFSTFMIQRNVIPLTIGVLLSLRLRTFINHIVDTLINPLFSIDYDKDGIPDISEISELLNISIIGVKYNFGFLFLELIKILMFIIVTYFFIIMLYVNTDYLNINFN
jgi:large-conductance mechanosensitive channel